MRIGVISDTHDFLDPRIPKLFAGVEHIIHGGDIGLPRILRELEQVTPVTAVCGNTDPPEHRYPATARVKLAGMNFLIHHIVNPLDLAEPVRQEIAHERPDVVVFGHTHKPFSQRIGGILFFNPGYAGKSRFGLERSVAVLNCQNGDIQWEYHSL